MKKRLLAVTLTIVLAACGAASFATQMRVVLAAGAPILTVLVQQGKINDSFRLKLVADLSEEADYVGQLGTCLDAASNKPQKLQCIQTFESLTRPLLERNFKTNKNVKFIADDVEAILAAAIIFYGGGSRQESAAVVSEKDIKTRIEKLKKDLGQQ